MAFTSTLRGRICSAIASATIHLNCNGLARILTAAAFTAMLSVPEQIQAQTAIVITQDLGGSVENRLRSIEQLRLAGTRVEIRGQCASACTMLLGLPNTCVARAARLGFHGPQSQYYGIALPPEEFEYWSRIMASHYPGAIKRWFMSEARQTTMSLITLTGTQAIKMGARSCS